MSRMEGNAVTQGGLFVSNHLSNASGDVTVTTPLKAQPVGRMQDGEEISPDARNLVEIVAEVDEDSLIAYESSSRSRLERTIEEKVSKTNPNSKPSEIVVCFWIYTGSSPISRINAQRMVQLSTEYSDITMPPLQHSLLQSHIYDQVDPDVNTEDEEVNRDRNHDLLRLYRIGTERFLEAAEDSGQLFAAPIPFLRDDIDWMTTRLADYSEMNIDMLGFNFLRRKPTSPENRDAIRRLIGYMRRTEYFDPTLKYAINIRHSYKAENGARSAEDIALAGMGFDVIGENHWHAPSEFGTDYERGCRIFDHEELAYHQVSQTRQELSKVWPKDRTKLSMGSFLSAHQLRELVRQEKQLNAEQIELTLGDIRSRIADEDVYEFLRSYDGYKFIEDGMKAISAEYQNPTLPQSDFGDFS